VRHGAAKERTMTIADDDVLWGVAAIAGYIRRTERQTYYLISKKAIPAKKLGARTIIARKSEIDTTLASDDKAGDE
jgi:hypothetical protein